MKIGIELRQVTFGASGGLAQYLQGTLAAAFANYPQHQFIVFCTIFNRSLLGDVPGNVTIHTLPASNFFQKIDQAAAAGEIEVLFRSFPMEAPLLMSWDRQIVLIPDLQHDAYPEFFTAEVLRLRRLAFHQAMARAGTLLAFTDYVRGTILSHPWNRCRNVFLSAPALTLGHDRTGELRPEEQSLIPTEDFFFYPANLWPHKNHRRVLQALADLRRRTGRGVRLILTGHPEGFEKLQADFPGAAVTHLGFVREPLMQALLAKAKALAFFSLHEGFGIPLLEAFHAGTPVICSNLTSLPEVGGDAVLSCDPRDSEAISGSMERILSDEPLRQSLIERGRARLSHYTWEAAAAGLIQAAEHAVRGRIGGLLWFPPPVLRGRGRVGDEFIGDRPPPQPSPGVPGEGENRPPIASRTAEQVSRRDAVSLEITEPPLVSIVTPSFNQGRYLKATIESVLSQSYPHVQYTVMDGGSTDESAAILKSYGGRFVWKSEKDNGQCDAINKGMLQAKGSILAFLNSDDVLLPGAIERIVCHFGENPDCDMVYGNANYLDEEGNVTGRYNTAEYSFQRLMTDCCVCQPAAFWRSRIAGLIGPLDASLHCALDYDYWLRMDRAGGRICHIHDFLAGSRLHAETKTMSLREKFYQEIFAVCMKNGGYVDYNYFLGLWHHRVTESQSGWPRWFKWLPGAYFPMARAHYMRFEMDRIGPKSAAWQMANSIIARAARLPLAGRLISRGARRIQWLLAPPRVGGFWADNWMEPRARIVVRPKAPGQRLRHVGIPPVDMQVTILAENKILGSYSLAAGKSQAIGEDICLNSSRPVTLGFRFSHHVTDAARRKLSFLVTETNLFGENDLA